MASSCLARTDISFRTLSKRKSKRCSISCALKLSKPADLGRHARRSDRARYIEFASAPFCYSFARWLTHRRRLRQWRRLQGRPEALWELGAEVISIGVEPDGFNINRSVGSTAPGALINKVREVRRYRHCPRRRCDRVIIVDETGKLVDGDQLMAAIAQSWKEDGRLSRPGIVATVMSNLASNAISKAWLSLARTAVGDRMCSNICANRVQSRRRAIRPYYPFGHCTTGDDWLPPCSSWRLSSGKTSGSQLCAASSLCLRS